MASCIEAVRNGALSLSVKANISSADAVVPSTGKEAGREMVTSDRSEIVVYQPNDVMRLEVRLENETVWLNRNQVSQLFGRDVKTIGKHIANALKEELNLNSAVG